MKPILFLLSIVTSVVASCPSSFYGYGLTNPDHLNIEIEKTVQAYRKAFGIPGAVVLVGHSNGISTLKAYGTVDGKRAAQVDTVYDLASITKLFTATALLKELEDRGISYKEPISKYLKEYDRIGVKTLSFEQLLRHSSGLQSGVKDDVFADSLNETWANILNINPKFIRGEFLYSDLNYLVLGKVLERLTSKSLDKVMEQSLLNPLSMVSSGFKPMETVAGCKDRCAPVVRGKSIGIVHDPTSRKLGGVAGHAGLYASAMDLSNFASIFLNHGSFCAKHIISSPQAFTVAKKETYSDRGLGFDITSPYSDKPRGDFFSKGLSFGHTGYTGTSIWIDPTINTYLIVLSNPVYAKNWRKAKKGFLKMIRDLADLVGEAYSL